MQKIAKILPTRSLHRDRHHQPTVILSIALTVLLDISTVRQRHVFTRLPAFLLETGPRYLYVIVSFLCISSVPPVFYLLQLSLTLSLPLVASTLSCNLPAKK